MYWNDANECAQHLKRVKIGWKSFGECWKVIEATNVTGNAQPIWARNAIDFCWMIGARRRIFR
jgi:hypothetical protein